MLYALYTELPWLSSVFSGRLNQDSSRTEVLMVAIHSAGRLLRGEFHWRLDSGGVPRLHECTPFPSPARTPSDSLLCLAPQEKGQLLLWKECVKEESAFVVCNKMNALDVDTAPIATEEALQLIVQNNPMFTGPTFAAMSVQQRLEQYTQMHAHMSEDDLDTEARKYKKPDEGATRQLVEEDVRGAVVRFTQAGISVIQVATQEQPSTRRDTVIISISALCGGSRICYDYRHTGHAPHHHLPPQTPQERATLHTPSLTDPPQI